MRSNTHRGLHHPWTPSASPGRGAGEKISSYNKLFISAYGSARGYDEMKSEIFNRGPVACTIDAGPIVKYTSGIATQFSMMTDHVVSVVGWGTEGPTEYGVVKNSFGTQWGELGYYRQKVGDDIYNMESSMCSWATPDDESVGALLARCDPADQLYVCGPKPMLDAVLAQTQARGWNSDRVHFELFTAPVVEEGDHAFEVELAMSGQRFTVPADQSILDCLIEHGCDPMFDCKRGECGVCAVPVIDGEIDHRDYVLTAREKAAGNVIQICISRAKGQRLVLDL